MDLDHTVFQVAHIMRLPIVDKEVDRCLHWSRSESCDLVSVVLFCFTEGVSCFSDPEGECQCMLSPQPRFGSIGVGNQSGAERQATE